MRNLKITDDTEVAKPKPRTKKVDVAKLTIIEMIEQVVNITKDCKFEDKSLKECKPYATALGERLSMSEMEAIFLAVFVNNAHDKRIRYRDIAGHFDTTNIKIMCYTASLDELVKKGYIRCSRSDDDISFSIGQVVVNSLAQNTPYIAPPTIGLDVFDLFERFNDLFERREDDEISTDDLSEMIKHLMEDNSELNFAKRVNRLDLESYTAYGFLLFLYFCHLLINNDDDNIGLHDIEKMIDSKRQLTRVQRLFKNSNHPLQEMGLIEEKRSEGLFSRDSYCLSRKVKEEILSDFELNLEESVSQPKNIISHESIAAKKLFYNNAEGAQIAQLSSLLENKNFEDVQARLAEQGMRKGFAALFYGSPGTGKTESVYQIARATGRDIVEVNVSQIKSMWVGESEKNIKATFDNYRKATAENKLCPILLFNEADAVLGVRQEGAARAVDKMENSIQNIILQEMETLDGIMIATTNLTKNLDKAFERRFLYKIEFAKPNIEAKSSIWHTMLPSLSLDDALVLAKKYDFSGGQIENIVRKQTVELIINGISPSFEAIDNYCQSENIEKPKERKRIGF